MSTPKRLFALAVLPALFLAGCSDSSSKSSSKSSTTPSSSSSSSTMKKAVTNGNLDDVSVDTSKNSVTIPKDKLPFGTADVKTKTLSEGSGKTIGDKDLVNLDYVMVDGTNGKQVDSSIGKVVARIDMTQQGQYLPGLIQALKGAKVGTKMVASIPASKAFGTAGSQQLGIGGNDDIVVYLNVKSSAPPLTQATGAQQTPTSGFPQVTVPDGKGKQASITIPQGLAKPTKTQSETLIAGDGDTIAKGDTISVNYTGQIWGGKVFDSTAKHNDGGKPTQFAIGIGQVIPGWDKSLVGKKVGDRVVIVVPPSDGYGSAGQPKAGIKGNDTLVFVVDILADYGYVQQQSSGN